MEEPVHLLAQTNADVPLQTPEIAWRAIAPELALAAAGVVLLLVVAFWPEARRGVLALLTLVGLAVSAALVAWNWDLSEVAFGGAVSLDGITRYARVVLLAVGALTTLMAVAEGERSHAPPEGFPLLLFALTGIALLLAGVALLAVGFCFKVAAVPFHMWTPDVYQGAPTPVTAFMAAGTKVAGFAIFLRVFAGALGGLVLDWRPVIAGVAVVTMLGGSVLAIVQSDVKRMLAYSSIAHAGYLLIGLTAAPTNPEGISASMFYLLAYAFMVMGAFMVVQYASRLPEAGGGPDDGGDARERSSLGDLRGLGRRPPWPAGLLALLMFPLAGTPPLSGFWAKYYVFQAGINAGLT